MMLACCRSLLLGDDSAVAHKMRRDRKSTRLNSSHSQISYAVFCLKKKKKKTSRIQHSHQKSPIQFVEDEVLPFATHYVSMSVGGTCVMELHTRRTRAYLEPAVVGA